MAGTAQGTATSSESDWWRAWADAGLMREGISGFALAR